MIEIWVPGLDPVDDPLLSEIEVACAKLKEIPARVLAWSIEDVLLGNIKSARKSLHAWAAAAGLFCDLVRKADAPVLWSLHRDGWRTIGMPEDMRALGTAEVVEGRESYLAHYDETVLVDFGRKLHYASSAESWGAIHAFPHCEESNGYLYADLLRRAKHDE